MRIICNSIGLHKETEVFSNERRLVTSGLSIKQLCDLWKWYYNISPFEKIELVFTHDKDYNAIQHYNITPPPTLSKVKTVKELLEEEGVICRKFDEVL